MVDAAVVGLRTQDTVLPFITTTYTVVLLLLS
jgi:hypothetical protein